MNEDRNSWNSACSNFVWLIQIINYITLIITRKSGLPKITERLNFNKRCQQFCKTSTTCFFSTFNSLPPTLSKNPKIYEKCSAYKSKCIILNHSLSRPFSITLLSYGPSTKPNYIQLTFALNSSTKQPSARNERSECACYKWRRFPH